MKKRGIIATAMLLIISVGNYFRIISNGSIRTIDFLSIFVIGVLAGVLLMQIIIAIRGKNKLSDQ
jgi:hypothetical protein